MDDKEKARAIYEKILKDAQANPLNMEEVRQTFSRSIEAATQLDETDRKKAAELTALSDAHSAAVESLKAGLSKSMDTISLATLLVRNQDFLQRLDSFDGPARDLAAKGRRGLSETLQRLRNDTNAVNAMIQYVLGSRGAGRPAAALASSTVPAMSPATSQLGALTASSLLGIWDATLADGSRSELALDNGTFSCCRYDATSAFWGQWTLNAPPGGQPTLCLARKGSYPAAFYGPLGAQPLVYAPNEIWGITSYSSNRISMGPETLVRRTPVDMAAVTARISKVQVDYSLAEQRNQNSMVFNIAQNKAIASVQGAMWDYINSGIGRPR